MQLGRCTDIIIKFPVSALFIEQVRKGGHIADILLHLMFHFYNPLPICVLQERKSMLHTLRIPNVPATALQWKMTKTVNLFMETMFFFSQRK